MSSPRALRILALATTAVALVGCGEGSALSPVSPEARSIAGLSWFLIVAGTIVYVLVMAALAVPLWRSRRRSDADAPGEDVDADADAPTRRRLVLFGGIVLPAVVVAVVVTLGATVGRAVAPIETDDDLVIEVVGHQFWWQVTYPDLGVVTANEIHVPTDRPVRLRLHSNDVIHSFWVPPLHGKIDLRPGAVTGLSFDVERAGEYRGRCAEYCGIAHAQMEFLVIAEDPGAFEDWVEATAAPADEPATETAARGQELFGHSCAACHDVLGHQPATDRGGEVLAPDLTHLASRRTLAAGTLENTRDRLRVWVADPHAVKPGAPMPPADLGDDELEALLDYLEGLE